MKVLIVANGAETHVGRHLRHAAKELDLSFEFVDLSAAYRGPKLLRALMWRLFGRRPIRLNSFSEGVVAKAKAFGAELVISTGIAPLGASALAAMKANGVKCGNFLTDDPWNPAHVSPWFMTALQHYHQVWTPRLANIVDLRGVGGAEVSYLPFAYAPDVHYPVEPVDHCRSGELLFVGGADKERVEMMRALAAKGVPLALWGGYWDREPDLARFAKGHAGPALVRELVGAATANLCLVRRANRDGHSMRSFELPAMRGAMVVERTAEHEKIFGEEGSVLYAEGADDIARHWQTLIREEEVSKRLGLAVREYVCGGNIHTYSHRLVEMLHTF
jgi:spore maturation protein CgeB